MENLQRFWTWTYLLGCGAFIVMATIIIPLGLRDLVRLLNDLSSDDHAGSQDDANPSSD